MSGHDFIVVLSFWNHYMSVIQMYVSRTDTYHSVFQFPCEPGESPALCGLESRVSRFVRTPCNSFIIWYRIVFFSLLMNYYAMVIQMYVSRTDTCHSVFQFPCDPGESPALCGLESRVSRFVRTPCNSFIIWYRIVFFSLLMNYYAMVIQMYVPRTGTCDCLSVSMWSGRIPGSVWPRKQSFKGCSYAW